MKANTLKSDEKSNTGIFSRFKTYIDKNRLGELLVMTGAITPQDLKFALKKQKETNQPLGQVFIQNKIISRYELGFILGRQATLRCAATALLCFISVTSVNSKKAKAETISDIPARIAIASITPSLQTQFNQAALFGSDEKRSKNIKPFTKWTTMFERFDKELKSGASNHLVKQLQKDLSEFEGRSIKAMANGVNKMMNAKRYIGDNKNWGQSDYWATPVQFLQRGGDCEDFAIAKYTALRMLGVPEQNMRVAIVHDNVKNIPHAVLVVYTGEGTVVLDNQIKHMVDGDNAGRYRPIFSINRTAWWLHTAPSTTVLASAR